MFRQLFLIIPCAVLLAACGGNAASTATPVPAIQQTAPTTSATDSALPSEIAPTKGPREYSTEEVQLPEPGTIVPPATQDPDVGKLFDSVALNRSGGIAGQELNVELTSDGTVTRDGVKSTAPADQVKTISNMLDQMGFFGMKGVFQAPGTSADIYTYNLTVQRNGTSRTVTAQDGYIPPALADLLQILSQLGSTK